MKSKFIASGFLIGIALGIIVSFIFPSLIEAGFKFNLLANQAIGNPGQFPSASARAVFNTFMLFPLLFGMVGALIGYTLYKIKRVLR